MDAGAVLASVMPTLAPADIFRGIVPLTFGITRFELPAGTMEQDEQWVAGTDASMRALLEGVRVEDQDATEILATLMSTTDRLLDAIYAYDREHILPPREELKRMGRSIDVLRGAFTIWVATNPTLAAGIAVQAAQAQASQTHGPSPVPSSSSPTSTGGQPVGSGVS